MDDSRPSTSWLPRDFRHPARVELPTGHHLRPIRADDVDLDHPAVVGSRERLWSIYGQAWGWPPATMTVEQDREDLARHEAEIEAHESFNYALFDAAESALLGCVYIDPTDVGDADAEVSWWVVDDLVGTEVEAALDSLVPAGSPGTGRCVGRSWSAARCRGPSGSHGPPATTATEAAGKVASTTSADGSTPATRNATSRSQREPPAGSRRSTPATTSTTRRCDLRGAEVRAVIRP